MRKNRQILGGIPPMTGVGQNKRSKWQKLNQKKEKGPNIKKLEKLLVKRRRGQSGTYQKKPIMSRQRDKNEASQESCRTKNKGAKFIKKDIMIDGLEWSRKIEYYKNRSRGQLRGQGSQWHLVDLETNSLLNRKVYISYSMCDLFIT